MGEKMKKILLSQDGSINVMTCFWVLAICMIWTVLLYFLMNVSVAQAQRKSAEQILDQYIQNNGIWIYNQVKAHSDKTDELLTEEYLNRLILQQGLELEADGTYCSYAANRTPRYKVKDVELQYIEDNMAKIQLTYTLHIPVIILGNAYWVEIPAHAYSRFNPKF